MSNSDFLNSNLNSIDWDFSNISNEGLNIFHWYPATFVSAIPGSLIPLLTKEEDVVLDAFCGTSITGLEAVRLGRKYIGIDNNPIAILISKGKLLFPDTVTLKSTIEEYLANPLGKLLISTDHPNSELLLKWYHKDTYLELLYMLTQINKIKSPIIKVSAQALFSSILKKASSQSKHWGWVCDNVTPKPSEIIYKNAYEIFHKALNIYCNAIKDSLSDIKNTHRESSREKIRKSWKVTCGDTVEQMGKIESKTIDLILTSPPYYGVADYVKAQRLSFLWFHEEVIKVGDHSFSNFEELRGKETGARSKRSTKSGFFNYIEYMKKFISCSYTALKYEGYLVLVLGDSKARNETTDIIDEVAINSGFKREFDFKRQIKDSKRRLMAKVEKEQILMYKKYKPS